MRPAKKQHPESCYKLNHHWSPSGVERCSQFSPTAVKRPLWASGTISGDPRKPHPGRGLSITSSRVKASLNHHNKATDKPPQEKSEGNKTQALGTKCWKKKTHQPRILLSTKVSPYHSTKNTKFIFRQRKAEWPADLHYQKMLKDVLPA